MPYRCVKCTNNHSPGDCSLQRKEISMETEADVVDPVTNSSTEAAPLPTYVNCQQVGHPASYRNCPMYKKIKQRAVEREQHKRDDHQQIVNGIRPIIKNQDISKSQSFSINNYFFPKLPTSRYQYATHTNSSNRDDQSDRAIPHRSLHSSMQTIEPNIVSQGVNWPTSRLQTSPHDIDTHLSPQNASTSYSQQLKSPIPRINSSKTNALNFMDNELENLFGANLMSIVTEVQNFIPRYRLQTTKNEKQMCLIQCILSLVNTT